MYKSARRYISNPILGLLPFLLYIILHAVMNTEWHAIAIAFIASVAGEIFIRQYFKSRVFSLAFYVVDISLVITFIFWFLYRGIGHNNNIYLIICEISMVCLYILIRISKTYIRMNFLKDKSMVQKALLNEFYFSSSLIQYLFTVHLFFILIYKYLGEQHQTLLDSTIFTIIPALTIIMLFVYEIMKVKSLNSKLRKEEWLPIITPKGEVTGKIAKSVSLKMKNKFLHPVIRVALVSNGKLFLQERRHDDILSPGKLDYPFEKYILFKHDLNLAARNSISQILGYYYDFPLSFLLKYEYENENTKRLNIVYVAHIDDESEIKRSGKMSGKFWTIKQIENGFADEIFSECFELEYEYLKNKVLAKPDVQTTMNNNSVGEIPH